MNKSGTIYEIAKEVGVSPASVSRVLSGVTGRRGKKKAEILAAPNVSDTGQIEWQGTSPRAAPTCSVSWLLI